MKIIAKFLTAATLNYTRKVDPYVYFSLSSKSTVSIAVKIISENNYQIFILNSSKTISESLMKNIPKYVDGFKSINRISINDSNSMLLYYSKKLFTPYSINSLGDLDTFFKSEPFIKSCVLKSEQHANKQDLYKFLVLKNNLSLQEFKNNFGEIEYAAANNIFKVDNWDIHYDSDLKIDRETITDLLHKATIFLNKKNLGRLAYGKIIIIKKLSGSAIADYSSNTDSIRLTANPKKLRLLDIFLHEVGHRNFKDLKREVRAKIAEKYREVFKPPRFSVGEKVKNKETDECYIIKDVDYKRNGYSYVVEKCKNDNKLYRVTPELATANYVKDGETHKENPFIVRAYSLTNYEEFYCELFYKWLINDLQEPAKTWMDNLNTI